MPPTIANANNLKGNVQPALNDLVAEMDREKEYSESPKKIQRGSRLRRKARGSCCLRPGDDRENETAASGSLSSSSSSAVSMSSLNESNPKAKVNAVPSSAVTDGRKVVKPVARLHLGPGPGRPR